MPDPGPDLLICALDAYLARRRDARQACQRLRRRLADLAVAGTQLRNSAYQSTWRTRDEVSRRLRERTLATEGREMELKELSDMIASGAETLRLAGDELVATVIERLAGTTTVVEGCDQLLRLLGEASARDLTSYLQLGGLATTAHGYQTVARALARDPRFERAGGHAWRLASPQTRRVAQSQRR